MQSRARDNYFKQQHGNVLKILWNAKKYKKILPLGVKIEIHQIVATVVAYPAH